MATRPTPDRDRSLLVAEKIARVMDGYHLDPLMGLLLPWAGDVIGAGLGLYPIVLAWRRGASKALLARMLLNLSVDILAGAIPILGDLWDFFFQAHRRNLALLRARWPTGPGAVQTRTRDRLVVGAAILVFAAALVLPVVLLVAVIASIGF